MKSAFANVRQRVSELRRRKQGPRWLVPEVIQTSSMDCGPAALASLLNGLGIPASYGRLREACQTDVDGTSIDTLEDLLLRFGLQAEQMIVPVDHILLDAAQNLPSIVVVRHSSGVPHFIVCWRLQAGRVQLMDPATGRRWQPRERFVEQLFVHSQAVPAKSVRSWLGGAGFQRPLARRMTLLGLDSQTQESLRQRAKSQKTWQAWARLDAAVRMVSDLVSSGALSTGGEASRLLEALLNQPDAAPIPDAYWTVRGAASSAKAGADPAASASSAARSADEIVLLRGAVLLAVRPKPALSSATSVPAAQPASLGAVLDENPLTALPAMLSFLDQPQHRWLLLALAASGAAAALQVQVDALFRGLPQLLTFLHAGMQKLIAPTLGIVFLLGFFALVLLNQWNVTRIGRFLEVKLRMALFSKLPRLNDHYFHSRPVSDMAERAHSIARVRQFPQLFADGVRALLLTTLTALALMWIAPSERWLVLALLATTLGMPLLTQPLFVGLDMRLRTYAGTLVRSYLDVLMGLSPMRTHGAERALARDHEEILTNWARSRLQWLTLQVAVQGGQVLLGYLLVLWLLSRYLDHHGDVAGLLLLYYWATALPGSAAELSGALQQYPDLRNVTMRLLEPLGAPAETDEDLASVVTMREAKQLAISLRGVSVLLAGHPVLQDVSFDIAAGSHVAVVGISGAGKSTLVGLLLGFHRAAQGQILINGVAVSADDLVQLRAQVAWSDPDVRLWNRSLFDNLMYAQSSDRTEALTEAIDIADLSRVMARLPNGLATALGEGGRLVSGGEGQRVRLGRMLLQSKPQLVLMDEPFRGLDRTQRQELLTRARKKWEGTTLIFVSHDIATTLSFPQVLVIENGRVIESGDPVALSGRADSRYSALLRAEKTTRHDLWASRDWQRMAIVDGQMVSGKEREPAGDDR